MPAFVLNRNPQSNGDHEVHNSSSGCSFLPDRANQIDLGFHLSCHGAVAEGKRRYPNVRINGCYYCANACHTT